MATSSARVSVTAEVVGTGSDGTEPSLLFSVQRHGLYSDDVKVLKRYLFNCGEGTQRLAGENGIKLSSLDAMYFTRFDVKSVSGVPGVIFALGSCGAATLRLHGPVGLRGFLGAIRSFVRRKYPQIQCVEISGAGEKLNHDASRGLTEAIEYDTWSEGVERTDHHALVIPIALRRGVGSPSDCTTSSQDCQLCEKNAPKRQVQDTSSSRATSTDANQVPGNQFGRRRENESDEHEQCREWLVRYYTEKVPAKLPYIDVVLNRYRGRYDDLKTELSAKYGNILDDKRHPPADAAASSSSSDSSSDSDNDGDDTATFDYAEKPLNRRWLEKFYAEHQPEKLAHIDRVLRQFSGRKDSLKQMLLNKYGQITEIRTHDEGAPTKRRKLQGSNIDDRIPKVYTSSDNPDERHSEPSDGVSNSLCYILQFQYSPYPVVWIIDCRISDHLADLERKFFAMTKNSACDAHLPSLVVHLSPAQMQDQPRYKQWMTSLSESTSRPQQLIFDGTALQSVAQGAFSYAFVSSAKVAVRREIQIRSKGDKEEVKPNQTATTGIQDLVKFLEGSSWSAEFPCRRQIVQRIEGCEFLAHVAQSKLQFCLLHPRDVQLGFDYERTGWQQKVGKNEDDDGANNGGDKQSGDLSSGLNQPVRSQEGVATSRKLIVLGTGSAAPSKLRASSGMYLELSGTNAADVDSMLVDCGEATFGQLWRQFGGDVSQRIGGLRCIWISHNHADHHCGLVRVLYEYWHYHTHRKDGKGPQPLVVVAPESVLSYVKSWLPQFLRSDSDQQLIRLANCGDFNDPRHPLHYQLLSEIGYAVTSIRSVRVFHCYDSYGLVLTLRGGKKLVYSGDTKPCNELVVAGMGAELLVHEATFDDSMEQDATMKKHSTVGQALDIARRMRARQVVLTHFSQRYPSLPPPVSDSSDGSSNTTGNVLCAYDGFVHPMPF
ncbi:Zinc phosphodiesterase ELAC protein 2 [Phytophthora pseudosyringae]|uniref:Zinc phosphodiesterase ELAC protein 2 n=1 Tax=Phytophthora pseudosyringae TaxID=221518 RepID=A0A8T1WFN2_9STRA|nr:Zinc phosphodiesterase ELAC protein 2 [Phytophthora pseudosyringae]